MNYPDIWGQDIIFAFSGLEGKTNWKHPFIAGTTPDFGKFIFRSGNGINFGFTNLNQSKNIKPVIISSDIFLTKNPDISMVFVENNSIIGYYSESFVPFLENSKVHKDLNISTFIHTGEQGVIVLAIDNTNKRFSYVYDSKNKNAAEKKAINQLSRYSIENEIKKKLNFFKDLKLPEFKTKIEEKTYLKAISIMKVNCESQQGKIKSLWTTPDRWPHRYMWFWDSAFHSFGNYFISPEIAEKTLLAVIGCQRRDGFISITMGPDKIRLYEKITQPPLFAWAGLELFKKTKNYDFLNTIYSAISKYMDWLYKNRDKNRDGFLEWHIEENPLCKCGESGMDNSPRFDEIKPDEPLAAIDLNCFAINEIECLSEIARFLNKKKESSIWKLIADEKKKMVNEFLYDKNDCFYYDRKQNGEYVKVKTVASFLPLFAGIPSPEKAKKIVEKLEDKNLFQTKFPIPSVAINEKTFTKDMWRGGTWLNYNFLIYKGLIRYGYKKQAKQLLLKTKKEVENWYIKNGSIFEFYDPYSIIPPKELPRKYSPGKKIWTKTISDYHWSAAVYVAIVNELQGVKDGRF